MQTAATDAAERDGDIVALLGAGQRERAFDALLPRYEAKVYRLCCALLRDRSQAEDAALERDYVRLKRRTLGYMVGGAFAAGAVAALAMPWIAWQKGREDSGVRA